jgi:hypothetical protein
MSKQNALTLVTPVLPARHDELDAMLLKIRADHSSGAFKEFEKIDTLHYARLVLLEDKLSTAKTNLVFSSDYDGDEDEHLNIIASRCGDLIDKLYDCCEGYLAPNERNPANRKKFLKKCSVKVTAFYPGAPGRSLKQIRQERALRNHIWDYLNKGKWDGKSAKEVHKEVKEYVFKNPEFVWANEQISIPVLKWWNFVIVIGLALLLLPLTLLLAVVVGIWLLVVRGKEKKDRKLGLTPSQLDAKFIENLEGYEDHQNQNQFTQIISMKPGWFRRITIKAILLYGKFRIYNEFVHGELMGIPTIHFARWVLLDNDKQVLFFSNFDGSWQQYLGDFIDKSGWGLTAIFSNTENFPASRYLFWGGAYDEEHFLAWSRYYQIPTHVWYCAYPDLSIKNVTTNSLIRSELIRDLNEHQAQTFLNRF